ncbi:MAG: hypothetical protein K2J82_08775, partial [Muribaculaceae bacterium]|nr:hypothetical protein [Muribaculaceae bacterium]
STQSATLDLLGYAIGSAGMSLRDFEGFTLDELEAFLKAHRKSEEARRRDNWEMTRLHACMTMQPHCSKHLNPKTLLPLPWEETASGAPPLPSPSDALSCDERRLRFLKRAHASRNEE